MRDTEFQIGDVIVDNESWICEIVDIYYTDVHKEFLIKVLDDSYGEQGNCFHIDETIIDYSKTKAYHSNLGKALRGE